MCLYFNYLPLTLIYRALFSSHRVKVFTIRKRDWLAVKCHSPSSNCHHFSKGLFSPKLHPLLRSFPFFQVEHFKYNTAPILFLIIEKKMCLSPPQSTHKHATSCDIPPGASVKAFDWRDSTGDSRCIFQSQRQFVWLLTTECKTTQTCKMTDWDFLLSVSCHTDRTWARRAELDWVGEELVDSPTVRLAAHKVTSYGKKMLN